MTNDADLIIQAILMLSISVLLWRMVGRIFRQLDNAATWGGLDSCAVDPGESLRDELLARRAA